MTILSPDTVPSPPRIRLHQIQRAAALPQIITEVPAHCGPFYQEIAMNQNTETFSAVTSTQEHIMPDVNINLNTAAAPTFPADSIQDILARGGVDVQPLEVEPTVKSSAWRTAAKYTAITLGVAAVAGGAYMAYRHFSEGGSVDNVIDATGEAAEALVS